MDIRTLKAHADEGLPFRISLEAVNRGVGLVALGLPVVLLGVSALGNTCRGIDSISHYYYSRLGGDILVGALCFIGVLLAFFYKLPRPENGRPRRVDGYLGHGTRDILAARFAGLCAFGVALVPAAGPGCEDYNGSVSRLFLTGTTGGHGHGGTVNGTASFDFWGTLGVSDGILTLTHYGAALGMFLVLAYYALVVFPRPQSATALSAEGRPERRKSWRNICYRLSGALILVAITALLYKYLAFDDPDPALAAWNAGNWTFRFEALALVAFGLSWCLKGRLFDIFRDPAEANPKSLPLRRV